MLFVETCLDAKGKMMAAEDYIDMYDMFNAEQDRADYSNPFQELECEFEDIVRRDSELKEFDRQIEEQKRLMALEISNLKKTYAEVIKSIELEKSKRVEKIRYDMNHTYSTDENGIAYRQATKKMLAYAQSIDDAMPLKSDYEGERVKRLYDFRRESGKPDDDFNMIHEYISKYAPIAKAIWTDNNAYMRESFWKSSYGRKLKREKELEEKIEQLEEENRHNDWIFRGTGYYDDGSDDTHIGPP